MYFLKDEILSVKPTCLLSQRHIWLFSVTSGMQGVFMAVNLST